VEGVLEFFGALLGLGLFGLVVILPIIALVRAGRAARLGKRNEESWQKLTQRIHALETQVQGLQVQLKERPAGVEQAPREAPSAPARREVPSPAAVAPPAALHPTAVAAGGDVHSLEPPRPTATVAPLAPSLVVPPVGKPPAPSVSSRPSEKAPSAEAPAQTAERPLSQILGTKVPARHATAKRVLNLEEVLGTDWLNKLGMMILVIGVALFLLMRCESWVRPERFWLALRLAVGSWARESSLSGGNVGESWLVPSWVAVGRCFTSPLMR